MDRRGSTQASPADIVAAAAPLAMGVVLASTLRSTRDEDEIWRDLGEGAFGSRSVVPFVLFVVAGVVAGLATRRRWASAHLSVVAAAGTTAVVAGALTAVVHVVARLAGDDGQGELIVPGDLVARVVGPALLIGLITAPLLLRRRDPAAVATTTVVLLGIAVLPWAAAFEDNSATPTPSRLSLVVVLLPLLISVVPARRLRGVRGPVFATAIALLGFALAALPWIVHDAMACDDDDCVPLPLAASWLLAGGLWLGAAVIGQRWSSSADRRG